MGFNQPQANGVITVMGVCGSGKTTVGKQLAEVLGWRFLEGDRYHPSTNVAKMTQGVPLTDEDRLPWLERINRELHDHLEGGVVLACSALKTAYREILFRGIEQSNQLVFLHGSEVLLRQRLTERTGHFMPEALLLSQLEALEPPTDALAIDISSPPEEIVHRVIQDLRLVARLNR